MSDFLVDLNKLRSRIKEAVGKGVFNDNSTGVFEQTLVQLVNEAEQNRQTLLNKAEQFDRQAATFRGQAQAFNSFKSMAYGAVDGLVVNKDKQDAAEKLERERAQAEAEDNEETEDEKETREEWSRQQMQKLTDEENYEDED